MIQYYIKIYNTTTNKLVGYYKDKGITNISRMKKGIKFWDTEEEALETCALLDNSFLRDEDKHYYVAHVVVIGEEGYKPKNKPRYQLSEEERNNELEAFIRQNYYRTND